METDLSGVWEKIQRAKDHISDLDSELRSIEGPDAYVIIKEFDAESNMDRWLVTNVPTYPPSVSLIAGDAAHNLRTSLDHLACCAVEFGGGQVGSDTAFPVWRKTPTPTAAQYESLVAGKLKGAPNEFIKAVRGVEAYAGGQHSFVRDVDYLDITDKHRNLLVVAGSFAEMALIFVDPPTAEPIRRVGRGGGKLPGGGLKRPLRGPVNDRQEVMAIRAKGYYETDIQQEFAFGVAFAEPGSLKGEPVIPCLTQLADAVERLVEALAPTIQ